MKARTPETRIFVTVGASNFPVKSTGSYCGKFYKVQQVIIHPDADIIRDNLEQFVGLANDLALIQLAGNLDFSQSCTCPICLSKQRPATDEECVISGYGCQDPSCSAPPPHSLQWVKVSC